jgi:hypothetical protein
LFSVSRLTGFIACSGIADLPFALCALFWLSRSVSPVDSGFDRGFNFIGSALWPQLVYGLLVPEHVGNTSKLRRRCQPGSNARRNRRRKTR